MSLVAIMMGSASDWETMQHTAAALEALSISYQVKIASAHRTPEAAREFVQIHESTGGRVFIVGAGLAAHLGGFVAAHTLLPVIGVPMAAGPLNGMDALLSTVQMPGGIPVATTSIGKAGAKNAAILAAQMLALSDAALAERLATSRAAQCAQVVQADSELASNFCV